ncbi:Nn.00g116940.m01.CDS01 [Neocucurbitaria sp. VM-36]
MFIRAALLSLSALAAAKEMPKDEIKAAELYDTGIRHANNVALKKESWARQEAAGAYNSAQYAEIKDKVECINGTAISGTDTFRCSNIDLIHFLSHSELGSARGVGSSSWGWTSNDGREFVAIGQQDGAAFAEISKEGKLVYLGRLPQYSTPSTWREIRGQNDLMIIGSEAENHGIQIFDMKKLLDIDPAKPVTFSNEKDLTGHFDGLPIGRTHNVVTNPDTNYIYAVGAQPRTSSCKSGIIFIDITDPSKPTSPGCASEDGYVHDAQCLIYHGPDKAFEGREICYGYNEDTLTIYDVTDKKAPIILSNTSYEGAAYTHQGVVLDKQNQHYLLLDDEYDEYDKVGPGIPGNPITYIWDISSLRAPKQTGLYKSAAKGVDHNQYVADGFAYQSNYGTGFRVLDVRSIPDDPTGAGVKEIGFFDIYPEDDNQPGGGSVDFVGTWSSYALFESGYILVNTMERGAFIVKFKDGFVK